jgi:DnaK suppressor protein
MNQDQLEQFRKKLVRLRSELQDLEEAFRETSKPVELDQSRVGRLSRMDAMQGQQMAMEAGRRRQHQLLKIEAAFRRIESCEYGYCLDCDEEIDIRRLEFDPTNTRCIGCAEKQAGL